MGMRSNGTYFPAVSFLVSREKLINTVECSLAEGWKTSGDGGLISSLSALPLLCSPRQPTSL